VIARSVRKLSIAAIAAALVAAALVQTRAATRDFIWKVSGKSGGVVYLVGSVHILSKDYYPLSPALEDAFKPSGLLVEEVDFADLTSMDVQFAMLSAAMLPPGQTLDQVLPPDTYQLLSKHLEQSDLPIDPLKRMKPWMIALTLEMTEWTNAGFDPELGLDKHFYDRAKADGKETRGLETAAFQLSLFDSLTIEQQAHMLSGTLKGLDTEKQSVTKLADAWKSGDAPTVERILLADIKDDPVFYKNLLVDRNRNWMPKIEGFFSRPDPTFVVVGAAHLLGPDGLLAALKAKGYRVEQQ
jgi:uncharacterized protein YbaP (TraB family)